MRAIRVAIADDQQLFCSGIQMLIESQPDLQFVGAAYDGEAAIALARQARPDVMLMDIRMPLLDGIEATARILDATDKPDSDSGECNSGDCATILDAQPKVIMLTTFQRDEAVVRAIHAGADGFIMKDTTPEFVLASIRTVYAGHSVIAPSDTADIIRAQTSQQHREPTAESISALSAREKEVFLLAARGLSNADIAQTAYISEATVKSHIRSILAKLSLTSRVQIVAHAYENGLLR
ncbi:response regulator transcription factor [Cryobacterium glaciale]|uniref:Response regulator transcription factor n=2 Tax=Cryobacterium glaciale TaxID=1259145 RepID=A0A4R8UZQ3_9MICO|nr:response regulator transcription factor [Cryobacterium glaciale]TFB75333.1 response regulator transcription factor [Cryobacterium glaciale]